MVPEERPTAAPTADRLVDPVRSRGSSRLATVRRDFFLNPDERLTEQERALMTAMFHNMVATIANEIGAAAGIRAYRARPAALAGMVARSTIADCDGLMTLMLRRADEYRATTEFSVRSGIRHLPLLPRLVSDNDPAVATSAMEVVIARGRRRDQFGQPRIELSDLAPQDAHDIVLAVAAAMAIEESAVAGVDDATLSSAAERILGSTEAGSSLDCATARLVNALDAANRDVDVLIEQLSGEGEMNVLAHLLAHRSGLPVDVIWDHLLSSEHGTLAMAARMSNLSRPVAARLIANLCAGPGPHRIEAEMAEFDSITPNDAREAAAYWQLPTEFRKAKDEIDG